VAIKNNLVRVHQTTHTVFNTEDVVVDTINVRSIVLGITYNTRRIESTEVKRPRWLEFGRVDTEWNQKRSDVVVTRRNR